MVLGQITRTASHKHTWALVATMCVGLMVAPSAYTASVDAEDLDTVVVTVQHLEETLPQQLALYGTKVDTVTAQQIKNGGYIDIASTLNSLVPGLYVAAQDGPFDYVDISLQGSRAKDVVWLVDGVRINNRLYGGTTPLDTLPAALVERIEVLDGGQSLFYGTQALAGAVNIVTKGFTKQPDGSVSLGGDTNRGWHVDANYRDSIGQHQFVVYASQDQSRGYQPFRDEDYQPSSTDRRRSYNVFNVGAKYAYDFTDNLRFEALYQYTDGKLDDAAPAYVATAFNERNEDLVSAKFDYTVNDSLQLFVKGYGHWWRSHYTEFDNVIGGNPGELDVIDDHDAWGYKDYGLNVMAKLAVNRGFEYFAGYDLQNYSGNDAVLVITDKSERVNAVFAQVRTTSDLLPKAHLAAGVRYNDPSAGPAATVWNASGKFDFTDHLFARVSGGTSFRLPTAEELFADDPNDERGNPNLKPEQSRNLNLSIGGQLGEGTSRFNWEAVGFFRNIRNLITFDDHDDATNQDVAINDPGVVRVRGVELDLSAAFNQAISAQLSGIYNQSRQAGDQQITRIPVRQYKALLDYHPASLPFGATATVNRVGKIFASVAGEREAYGDYTVVDVAGRIFLDKDRRNTINIRVENVFDKQYASLLGSTQRDADGSDYTIWHLGLPRTLTVRYTHQF